MAKPTIAETFWDWVDTSGECHLWTRAIDGYGYGVLWFEGRLQKAHRVAWYLTHGEWPPEDLDHVRARGCVHKACVRVEHLEPVTHAENMKRAVTAGVCKRGHAIEGDNIALVKTKARTSRTCRRCRVVRMAQWRADRKP